MDQKYFEHTKVLVDRTELLRRIPKHCCTCEVGVATGNYSREIVDICQPRQHTMIDAYAYPGVYDEQTYNTMCARFAPEICSGLVNVIRMDSYAGIGALPDAATDFIYIDSSHSYEVTKKELCIAHRKISQNGIIAGHDYVTGYFNFDRNQYIQYGVIDAVFEFMVEFNYYMKWLTHEDNGHRGTPSFALQRFDALTDCIPPN